MQQTPTVLQHGGPNHLGLCPIGEGGEHGGGDGFDRGVRADLAGTAHRLGIAVSTWRLRHRLYLVFPTASAAKTPPLPCVPTVLAANLIRSLT